MATFANIGLVSPPWHPLLVPPAIIAAVSLLYLGYSLSRPKPLPGIPYNKNVGLLGDLPELFAIFLTGKSARPWFWGMAGRHSSPIVQFFLRPFDKPTVIVVDYRETHDILHRRTKEFDRSVRSNEIFSTIIPNHHIAMRSSDPHFRANKELVRDLMTPSFLHEISAPAIYDKVMELVGLWDFKARIAEGRPFAAFQDINEAATDFILSVALGFGGDRSIVKLQLESLTGSKTLKADGKQDEPFVFNHATLPPDIHALSTVNNSLLIGLTSPIPRLHHWVLRNTIWRKEFAVKERLITNEIGNAASRLSASVDGKESCRCAMDYMIWREMSAAKKTGREPVFDTPSMRDELLGYLIAGYETSSTTLAWMFKFLSDYQEIQLKLRRQLHAAYAVASAEKRQPTVAEITEIATPYLDAFVEESLRHTQTLPILMRDAVVDTSILGHPIPKGTTVMFLARGASYTEPAIPVSDDVRSASSRASKERVPDWDDATIHLFAPERWLKPKANRRDEDDEFEQVEFNAQAGPFLTFGAGPRGCFGRRLAYLQLRIITALLVWNFEFHTCPPKLSSYEGTDLFTTIPQQCYLRLTRL